MCMKMKSVSGVVLYSKDLQRSIDFYEKLGFEFRKRDEAGATAYLNWFWIDVRAVSTQHKAGYGPGQFIYIKVDDAKAAHKALVKKDLKPDGPPEPSDRGKLEFTLSDPDGYKLAFFD